VTCCGLSCHTGSSWSILSRVQRSWKLVMNLRHLQVASCSCRRCSTTSHPRFPNHFHLRRGCASILTGPRINVITVGRSDGSRWPISDPVCLTVSTIKSLSFHWTLLTSTSDMQAMAVFPRVRRGRAAMPTLVRGSCSYAKEVRSEFPRRAGNPVLRTYY
jgi:hypothetical protein